MRAPTTLALAAFALSPLCIAQEKAADAPARKAEEKKWYDRYGLRGYTQLRYNRLGGPDPALVSDQDRSIGDNGSFFFRRVRLILSGEAHERVSIYIQGDFSQAVADPSQHFMQMRDAYADVFLDADKELRVRAGQSKVPFGWENLQSSQNRLALDRNDALNSAVPGERDLGVFVYWAPSEKRKLLKHLVDSGLKGSGDYGVLALGAYNGQAINRREANDNRHLIARASYPFELEGQVVEAGLSGYTGAYTVTRSAGKTGGPELIDQRLAAHFVIYPQPFGFQAEYNVGRGPELEPGQTAIGERALRGGYLQALYRSGGLTPFVRYQYYRGGKKAETDAPANLVRETELGVEWQATPAVELTGEYTFTDRTSTAAPYANVSDNLIRLQLQWNY
jgi:phosphate-selective porin